MGARSHEFRARCVPRLCHACPKEEEEFHERVRATFVRKGPPAFLSLFPARGRGPLFFFLPCETSGGDISLSFSLFPSPFLFLSSRPEQRVQSRVCACVARIINRDLFAPTLLILTSGKIFLLGA